MTGLLLSVLLGADGGIPESAWEFDGRTAKITARAQTADQLSRLALERLGVQLQGPLQLRVNAHANSVGGVTLRAEDPSNSKAGCDFYAKVDGDALRFTDSRCTFLAFSGNLQTTATCRKISGTAKKNANGGVDLEAHFPDCNAAPMGVSVTLAGDVVPR